jgi:hypothetical protein
VAFDPEWDNQFGGTWKMHNATELPDSDTRSWHKVSFLDSLHPLFTFRVTT